MLNFLTSFRASRRFYDYRPQPLNWLAAKRWIDQFDKVDRKLIARLLNSIIYLSEADIRQILVHQNQLLLQRLTEAGLKPTQLIYVQYHDAGSSSPAMLNLLRDASNLQKLGCNFIDARSIELIKKMNEIGTGALIYIDDFIGSGTQFCLERDFIAKTIVGTFSEFVIATAICEEGMDELAKRGVEAFAGHVHSKVERPLHAKSALLKRADKDRLELVCKKINRVDPLGYKGLASMVVLSRNAPDTIPLVFRGSPNQSPFKGIFPRASDLPVWRPAKPSARG